MVGSWVRHYENARLTEGSLDLVGEGTRSETTSYWMSTSVPGKLENGTLRVRGRGSTNENSNTICDETLVQKVREI